MDREDRSTPKAGLSHLSADGSVRMVDVSDKDVTHREAVAAGEITLDGRTLKLALDGDLPKGNVLETARIAGIMAAKRTSELIPLCHPLGITGVDVAFTAGEDRIEARATVRVPGRTGVEMEALTAVSVCLLTVYDMCKAVDKTMAIGNIRLLKKTGGRTGEFHQER